MDSFCFTEFSQDSISFRLEKGYYFLDKLSSVSTFKDLIFFTNEFESFLNFVQKKKVYHLKDWFTIVEPLKKDYCENCGCNDNNTTYVFQHLDILHYKYLSYRYYVERLVKNLYGVPKVVDTFECCPFCEKRNFHFRKTIGNYRCAFCGNVFDKLKTVTKEINKNDLKKFNDMVVYYSDYFIESYKDFLKKSILSAIDYLQFKNVKTFCKGCAFLYDREPQLFYEKFGYHPLFDVKDLKNPVEVLNQG